MRASKHGTGICGKNFYCVATKFFLIYYEHMDTLSRHEPSGLEARRRISATRFEYVLKEVAAAKIPKGRFEIMVQTISSRPEPILRRPVLKTYAKESGLSSERILSLVRRYKKEQVRMSENGELYHYHQTSLQSLESALSSEGLLSYDSLKKIGKTPSSSGSRPDVVQMTRDRYDANGTLTKRGLMSVGVVGAEVALVFNPSIMDLPDYDCTSTYPDLPFIPLDTLGAVLIKEESSRSRVTEMLKKHKLGAQVLTMEEWSKKLSPLKR